LDSVHAAGCSGRVISVRALPGSLQALAEWERATVPSRDDRTAGAPWIWRNRATVLVSYFMAYETGRIA
jgi:hypothetical protein